MNTRLEDFQTGIATPLGTGTRLDPADQGNEVQGDMKIAGKSRCLRRNILWSTGLAVVGVAAGVCCLRCVAPFESADDAFIKAHVTPIASQVAGRVDKVLVRDNQLVNAGFVLVQIEPSDYEAKLEQPRRGLGEIQCLRPPPRNSADAGVPLPPPLYPKSIAAQGTRYWADASFRVMMGA